MRFKIGFAIALASCLGAAVAPSQTDPRIEFHHHFEDRLEERRAAFKKAIPKADKDLLGYAIAGDRTWLPGSTLRVAFDSGTPHQLRPIIETAKEWLQPPESLQVLGPNLRFSFLDSEGRIRRWSRSDTTYHAEIRITFGNPDDAEDPCTGYYSVLGTDAVDPWIAPPNAASMCLEGLATDPPTDWQRHVRHEFGHAIGFYHEHQRPGSGCDDQYRWDDDPGYIKYQRKPGGPYLEDPDSGLRPGLFTLLQGPGFGWSLEQIKHNLKDLPESQSTELSPAFDSHSIMKYSFPRWMYLDDAEERCILSTDGRISDKDRRGALLVYPVNRAQARSMAQEKLVRQMRLVEAPFEASKKRYLRWRLEVIWQQWSYLQEPETLPTQTTNRRPEGSG